MTIKGKAYIAGAFEHPTRKATDKSVAQLHMECAKGALEDAGLSFKDVDGYFTADPATHADAARIPRLSYSTALQMADDGCPLVQRHAIAEAASARLPLVIRSLTSAGTVLSDQE